MRHLVLGGSGFVGSHLVEHLLQQGEGVRAVVRQDDAAPLLQALGVPVATADFSDSTALRRLAEDSDVVYNCVALVEDGLPHDVYEHVHVRGVHTLLLACRSAGLGRIVHLSSAEVHGSRLPEDPIDERHPGRPAYEFQRSIAQSEEVVAAFFGQPDLSISVLRPVLAFGPRDRGLTQTLLRLCSGESNARLVDDGRAGVSLIYVRDLVRALHLLGTDDRASGQTYLVKGFDTTWRDLVNALSLRLGTEPPAGNASSLAVKLFARLGDTFSGARAGSALSRYENDLLGRTRLFDDRRIRAELGFEPQYDLDAALDETAASAHAAGKAA